MTLGELIAAFRVQANDKVEPYFWSDEEVTSYLNHAQKEAAKISTKDDGEEAGAVDALAITLIIMIQIC